VNVFRIITARVSEREGEVMSRENRREGAATGMQRARRIDLLLLMLCRTLPLGKGQREKGREGNRQRRGRRRMEDPVPSRIASIIVALGLSWLLPGQTSFCSTHAVRFSKIFGVCGLCAKRERDGGGKIKGKATTD
jgi:hypothetical protein